MDGSFSLPLSPCRSASGLLLPASSSPPPPWDGATTVAEFGAILVTDGVFGRWDRHCDVKLPTVTGNPPVGSWCRGSHDFREFATRGATFVAVQ